MFFGLLCLFKFKNGLQTCRCQVPLLAYSPVLVMCHSQSRELLFVSSRGEILWQRGWLFLVIAPHERHDLVLGNWPSLSFSLFDFIFFHFSHAEHTVKVTPHCMIKYCKACPQCLASNLTEKQLLIYLLLVVPWHIWLLMALVKSAPEALNYKLSVHKPLKL